METQSLYDAEMKTITDCVKLMKGKIRGKKQSGRKELREKGERGKKDPLTSACAY